MEELSLSCMPSLTNVAFDAFHGLPSLKHLNISHNPGLTLVHSHLFDHLPKLASIDLSYNNLSSLSLLTFHNNHNLQTVKLDGNHFTCNCGLAWLAKYVTTNSTVYSGDLHCLLDGKQIHLTKATNLHEMCNEIPQVNTTEILFFAIGSSAHITCEFEPDPDSVVIWTTPRNKILTYHAFHPDVISHMLSKEDMQLNSSYHASHYWHNSSSYYASLSSFKDRIVLLNDGSLYIDYVLRLDNGPYKCLVMNANYNSSDVIMVRLDYSVLFNVKVISIIVGSGCAISFLLLNIIYSIIRAIARRLVNKRRRVAIRKLLENLDLYKTTQFARLRENYSGQLNRIRDQYHNQFHRLSENYNSQLKRVRQGCSHQVVRIRDNYTTKVGRLRNYSSHQIEQIRRCTTTSY
ncbi:leucine-rich repeat-containing protein 4B-like [Haliotis rubra]|uniref:leucine-rich repeat-containing protein 4B-like n=1 Tax=Haliotis rubra TaxID=36100 RepID=UPI001EE5316D|nr:leucine-rich repeat-containing protein 4B-like [Haliotis rubra]